MELIQEQKNLFLLGIARKAKDFGAKASDEIHSDQPMTSLFEQSLLLFGDTTASMPVKNQQINIDDLWQFLANLE